MNPINLTRYTFTAIQTDVDETTGETTETEVTVMVAANPMYASVSDEVDEQQHPSATGQSAVPTAPAMQRYTDEELMDCPEEQCLTAQWDAGDAVPGSFESSLGTHQQ